MDMTTVRIAFREHGGPDRRIDQSVLTASGEESVQNSEDNHARAVRSSKHGEDKNPGGERRRNDHVEGAELIC